jgi:hypothetical protein
MEKKNSIQGPVRKITHTINHSTKPHCRYVHMNAISKQFKMLPRLSPPKRMLGMEKVTIKHQTKANAFFDETYT